MNFCSAPAAKASNSRACPSRPRRPAVGGLISGVSLSLIGFPADLASKGGDKAHIAASTITDLGLAYGIVPGAMTAACIVFTMLYRIDRKAYADIQEKLTARRALAPAQLSDTQPIPENSPP